MTRFTRVEETRVLMEAVDYAMRYANINTMYEAVDWAINEYRWHMASEYTANKGRIKRKIDVLVAIRNRMECASGCHVEACR